MRLTHYERFIQSFGHFFEDYFKQCERFDPGIHPISEQVICDVFATGSRLLDLSLAIHLYHAWKDKNFYELTPNLCDILTRTELRDIDTSFIMLPERSMYLSLPPNNNLVVPCDQTGRLHKAAGIYLSFINFQQPTTIFLGKELRKTENVIKHLSIMVVGEEIGEHNDALIYFNLCFWHGKVSDSIERNVENTIGLNNELLPHIREAFNLVSKVLLYISCSNAVLRQVAGIDIDTILGRKKNKGKIRKQAKRLSRLSSFSHKQIDATTISKRSIEQYNASVSTGRKVLLESVSPHFKVQHFGPQNSQTKIIHIDGYERGELAGKVKSFKKKHIIM